jgi:hypothetical protein
LGVRRSVDAGVGFDGAFGHTVFETKKGGLHRPFFVPVQRAYRL